MNVDEYLGAVARAALGPAERKAQLRAEVETHLREAADAGDLDGALARLGSAREAAATFSAGRVRLDPAPLGRRALAAAFDYGIFGVIVSAVPIAAVVTGRTRWVTGGSPSFLKLPGRSLAITDPVFGTLSVVVLVAGLVWFAAGLTLIEWRTGRTPGKALAGLRVASDDGLALTGSQAVLRRLPLWLSGGLQIVDWAFALVDPQRRRAFDRVARTIVVRDRAPVEMGVRADAVPTV